MHPSSRSRSEEDLRLHLESLARHGGGAAAVASDDGGEDLTGIEWNEGVAAKPEKN